MSIIFGVIMNSKRWVLSLFSRACMSLFLLSLMSCAAELENKNEFTNLVAGDAGMDDTPGDTPDDMPDDMPELTNAEQCAAGGEYTDGVEWYGVKCASCHDQANFTQFAPGGVIDAAGTVVSSCGNGEAYINESDPESGFIYQLIIDRRWESECTNYIIMDGLFKEFFQDDGAGAVIESQKACLLDFLTP